MAVNDTHPEYENHRKQWKRTEAAAVGSPLLRLNNLEFLPEAYAKTEPERYAAFCKRAYYVNLTGRTEKVLQGMVFRKAANYSLTPRMQEFLEDMDGDGESIGQIAKETLIQRLRKNRHLLLSDYPEKLDNITEAEEKALGRRPVCAMYSAESLINWKWGSSGGVKRLVLAVLQEEKSIAEDEFGHKCEEQYRVLRLRDGVYTQQLYDKELNPVTEEFAPLQANKQPFDYIPLHGVRRLEVAALQPVAEVNLAYYWNTAKVEDLVDVMGSPNLHIDIVNTDIDASQKSNPNFKLGARTGTITKGGKIELVQAAERPLMRTVREDKLNELAAIGAAIVAQSSGAETAEAARIRAGSETSILDNEVGNLGEDLEAVLEDFARFIGEDPDKVEYKLNTDFFDTGLTAQELDVIVRGQILYGPKAALNMIRQGRIELPDGVDDDELQEDAANVIPTPTGGVDGFM